MTDDRERMPLRDAMLALHGVRRDDDVVVTSMGAARESIALGTQALDLPLIASNLDLIAR